jgi:hypothetical protein
MVTRMLSRQFFPAPPATQKQTVGCPHCRNSISIDQPVAGKDKEEPVQWIVGEAHPLVPNTRVMRMFVEDGVVEVYSVSNDPKGGAPAGMRNLVPIDHVILVEEAMPFEVFVECLEEAEDMGAPEPGAKPGETPAATNGQSSVS